MSDVAKKRTPAEDEYLGTRAAYGTTSDGAPSLTVEVPIQGRPQWRGVFEYVFVEERFILAEIRLFPAGDRLALVGKSTEIPRVQPVSLNVGQWSRSAAALADVKGNGITSRMLRELPFDDVDKAVRSRSAHRPMHPFLSQRTQEVWERVVREQGARPRSAGRTDAFYVAWALRFLECLEEDQYRPYVLMSERYGVEVKSARNYVDGAKNRILMVGLGSGKRGARLTQKGERVRRKIESTVQDGLDSGPTEEQLAAMSLDELWESYTTAHASAAGGESGKRHQGRAR